MDDEETIRKLLYQGLTGVGYEVEVVEDGTEAIKRYAEAKEMDKPFDAVVLDLTVPGDVGGKEAINKLREIDPEVTAIVTSGYSSDPVMAEYEEFGFSAVVTKPYSVVEIEKTLYNLLKKGK